MAAKNGCSESVQMLLIHGAFLEAKTTVSIVIRILLWGFVLFISQLI